MSVIPDTEAVSPHTVDMDGWSTKAILQTLWEGQLAAVAAVGPALASLAPAVEEAALRLADPASGGRLVYVGAGTSGRIGAQDGAELAPTFDWPPDRLLLLIAGGHQALLTAVENAEDQADAAREAIALHGIGPADVVIGLAASGGTAFTVAALNAARVRGALTIGIANAAETAILQVANYGVLAATGAEAVAGSTRLKAGTAQKVVLNLFSTTLMVRLHRVFKGRMVEMQARNSKLRRRSVQMVKDLASCSEDSAITALASANGRLKLALLIAQGLEAEQAELLLTAHGGNLRAVFASLSCMPETVG